MDLLEKLLKTHKDFLLDAEKAFLEENGTFAKTLADLCPLADMDSFMPVFQFADNLYCVSFVCNAIGTFNTESATAELVSIIKIIKDDKRAILKNFRNGAYEEVQKEEGANMETVENWLRNTNILSLSDFAFFRVLRPSTKAKYYLHELLYYAYSVLLGNEEDDENFVKYPTALVEVPFFMLGTTAMPDREIDYKKGTMALYYENITASGVRVKTYINKTVPLPDNPTEEDLEEICERYMRNKVLDPFDRSIFVTLYNLVSADIAAKGYLVISWKDFFFQLTKKQGKDLTDTIHNQRKKVEDSLAKFKTYDVTIQTEEKENGLKKGEEVTRAYNVFINGYTIYKDRLRIEFSENFLDSWLSSVTEKVVFEEYERASQGAKQFIFYLQNKRVLSRPDGYAAKLDLTEMLSIFPGRRKDKFLEELRSALDEFILAKAFVKEYKIKSPYLTIQFLPLSDEEERAYSL